MAVAAACGVSARLVPDRLPHLPKALDGLGLALLVYLTATALDGPALTIALAAEAVTVGLLVLAALTTNKHRALLTAAAAVTLLYLASAEIVTPFQPGETTGLALGELGVREQGQALLSAMWAATGFAALLGGLIANLPNLRRGALALLLATVAKVFLYDLASLTEIYRVASFIVPGLLLLGGAFAWQRVRPQRIPDLRVTPQALR